MKIVDVNVLLYVVNQDAPQHDRVRTWWEKSVTESEPIGLAWMVILGFLRLATRAPVFDRPFGQVQAIAKIETWLALPSICIVGESENHWQFLKRLLDESFGVMNLANDAHLAAIAIGYGATIVSCDADFSRFKQVRWENPLLLS